MKSFKWDHIKSARATIQDFFGEDDPILLEFDVVPFDHNVKDLYTSKFYVSMKKLAFNVDDLVEIYDLKSLTFSFIGKEPKFLLWEQILEYNARLEPQKFPLTAMMEIQDEFFRFSMSEVGMQPKQFTLRKGETFARSFQTWAMVETIKKLRVDDEDRDLHGMIYGNFSSFEPHVLAIAFFVFVIYVLLSITLSGILPGIVKTFLDSLFALGCLILGIWLVWSMHNNSKRYADIYERYRYSEEEKDSTQS
jgi:hypothetical protein